MLFAPRAEPADRDTLLRLVYDRQQIGEVLHRYARAIDGCDVELLKSVYREDGTDAHGSFDGNAHEFAEFMIPRLKEQTSYGIHHVTNELVEVDGDRAIAEPCLFGYHRVPGGPASVARFFGEGYADRVAAEGTLDGEHEYFTGGQCQPSRMLLDGGRAKYDIPGARDLGDPSYELSFDNFDE